MNEVFGTSPDYYCSRNETPIEKYGEIILAKKHN